MSLALSFFAARFILVVERLEKSFSMATSKTHGAYFGLESCGIVHDQFWRARL